MVSEWDGDDDELTYPEQKTWIPCIHCLTQYEWMIAIAKTFSEQRTLPHR
jgi:hypothetical protein